jgi:hypothetical protein
MVDPTRVINKAITYFCIHAVTQKAIENMGKFNTVDSALSSKNVFTQMKENVKQITKHRE